MTGAGEDQMEMLRERARKAAGHVDHKYADLASAVWQPEVENLGTLADLLANRLRSAYAVIERIKEAQFNPAVLDRMHEALDEYQAVRRG